MIFPTPLAIALAAAGAPAAMLLGAVAPSLWLLGLVWIVVVGCLVAGDAIAGADRRGVEFELDAGTQVYLGMPFVATVDLVFRRGRAPSAVDIQIETNELFRPTSKSWRSKAAGNRVRIETTSETVRRGVGEISRVWVEWRGPMRLVVKRRIWSTERRVEIIPNIRAVRDEALRIFARDTSIGSKSHLHSGGGSEFEALRDFLSGMDRRTIDWKQSARHTKLLAKEFRTEQDQTVIFAIDTGRLMCEPLARVPKIDHAIHAALLMAFVSLKLGDRVGIFGFDARPNVSAAPLSGISSFPLIQRHAARLDYSAEETNFTLGLSQLSAEAQRRSLIVIFTDFADPTSAELMIENVGRLVRKHLVLFVAIRDEELETITTAEPEQILDATRSVIAHSLLMEREVVLSRLKRLGVELVDAPVSRLGPDLLNRYLDVKRASRI